MFLLRIITSLALLFFVVSPASARHAHHQHHSHLRHHHAAAIVPAQPSFFPLFNGNYADYSSSAQSHRLAPKVAFAEPKPQDLGSARPRDCYGIAWCGCFLRHHFGLSDTSLNLARRWANVGTAASSPHNGAVVVWPHHVGQLQSEPDAKGQALVLSGNDGAGEARVRLRSIRGAIAFRDI